MYFIRRTTFRGRQDVAGSSCSRTAGAGIDSQGCGQVVALAEGGRGRRGAGRTFTVYSRVHGRLIREVQLGDPVEGLLAAVEDVDEPAGLGAPQAGNLVDQRQVDVEVMPVEGVGVFRLDVEDHEFDRHAPNLASTDWAGQPPAAAPRTRNPRVTRSAGPALPGRL
jgi:hypothetical protein